jgi:hypothetical protein
MHSRNCLFIFTNRIFIEEPRSIGHVIPVREAPVCILEILVVSVQFSIYDMRIVKGNFYQLPRILRHVSLPSTNYVLYPIQVQLQFVFCFFKTYIYLNYSVINLHVVYNLPCSNSLELIMRGVIL